jgi:isoleucyl-tRNA synthetase
MFEPVSPNVRFPDLEERWLDLWEKQQVFEKSVEQGRGKPPFVYYEGPPTANGMPHPGHVLGRVIKDLFLRYRTMSGYYVPRRGGWDTHGLPVEVEVEKELGIHGRVEIERFGVDAFTRRCVESVFRYIDEWRRMTERIGFWIDLDDAYVTFHEPYVESVWWALAQLFRQDLLYQDYKVVWWWPQGGTALSSGEVGQGYKTVDDPSIVVRFRIVGEPNTSLLSWTTTPWTLPSNVALAIHPEEPYATVETEDGERLILAAALVHPVLGDRPHRVVDQRPGRALVGTRYEPLFRYSEPEGGRSYEVIGASFVTLDTGTGVVHIAPAFGEDDFRVAREEGLGFLQLVQPDGSFSSEATDFGGRFCKEADRDIIRNLRERGLLYSEAVERHEYPFCWRAEDDPLIQYARRSWFIRTTAEIERVIANNALIHWEPEHIREGRFGDFLRNNVDWALSRERWWGTPLPIWVNDETGRMEAIDSVKEILERNPEAFRHFEEARQREPDLSPHLRVHKPWIDQVTWTRPGEPGVYRRVPEVVDCWFDSGCMPFAQWGYPHRNREEFEKAFPSDFITEALDQTRGWFYSLLTISTLLFPEAAHPHPYRTCYVQGLITDERGLKLSKSKKNYEDPLEVIAKHGADAVRWSLYASCVPGQSTRLYSGAAVEAVRDFLLKIWNVYSFFVTYARIDQWDPTAPRPDLSERSELDRWILGELDTTVHEVRASLDESRSYPAARRTAALVEALSNWYVRRSRARFWAEADTADKRAAFATLYEVLVELSSLIAPFVPFVAESLHQNLVRGVDGNAPVSVHLASYPESRPERMDEELRVDMNRVRAIVTLGQRVRAAHRLKVRQPLGEAIVVVAGKRDREGVARFEETIREELNVHGLTFTEEPERYVEFSLVPNFRALGPRLGKRMPLVKKALQESNGTALFRELDTHGQIELQLEDGSVTLGPEEIEVRLTALDGFAAAAEGGRVVVLDTRITDALRREGLAREVVNRVQRARKEMDLAYEARIRVRYEAEGELEEAIREHVAWISSEILATELEPRGSSKKSRGVRHEAKIEGTPIGVWIEVLDS